MIKMINYTKKGLVLLTMAIILMSTIIGALAVPMPHEVWGTVTIDGKIMPFYNVDLIVCDYRQSSATNCVQSSKTSMETDATGSFIFEMANLNPDYRSGDLVKLDVCDGSVGCEKIMPLGKYTTNVDFKVGEGNLNDNNIVVVVAGEPTKVGNLRKAVIDYKWYIGFSAMILALVGAGAGWAVKARKMAKTSLKKINANQYKK